MTETNAGRDAARGAYRVLARKYRPKDFSDLIGQEPMVRTLTNAFRAGRIAQAWMLTGVRGVGKTTTARILARALNYRTADIDRPTVELGEPGEHCQAIMEGRHVDVVEMDAASHTGIDDVREIIEQVRYAPVSARYKVYIIDEVHMLSTQAFNGLLKTLEEPPPHVKFIFATTEIRKVPVTVLSRCQRFDLRRIEAGDLITHLTSIAASEGVTVAADALAMIARAAEGSVRDALSLLDQAIAHGAGSVDADEVRAMLGLADRARVIDLFRRLVEGDVRGALAEFRDQYDQGGDPAVILTDLAAFTHFVTRLKFAPEAIRDPALSEADRRAGTEFAEALGVRILSRLWQMLLKAIGEAREAHNPLAAAEMALIRMAHAADLPTLDEALARIGNDAPPPAAGAGEPRRPAGGAPAMLSRPAESSLAPALRPAAEPADPAPEMHLASLADIARLADDNRDMAFKIAVKRFVRLVSIEAGRIEIALAEGASRTLAGELSERLGRWTGRRWMVSVAREGGGATMAETENDRRQSAITDARADPAVAAVLAAFPGARIIDVRIPDQPDALSIDAAPPPADDEDD